MADDYNRKRILITGGSDINDLDYNWLNRCIPYYACFRPADYQSN
jgi:hypothetical protein